jgi:hypothetical protein
VKKKKKKLNISKLGNAKRKRPLKLSENSGKINNFTFSFALPLFFFFFFFLNVSYFFPSKSHYIPTFLHEPQVFSPRMNDIPFVDNSSDYEKNSKDDTMALDLGILQNSTNKDSIFDSNLAIIDVDTKIKITDNLDSEYLFHADENAEEPTLYSTLSQFIEIEPGSDDLNFYSDPNHQSFSIPECHPTPENHDRIGQINQSQVVPLKQFHFKNEYHEQSHVHNNFHQHSQQPDIFFRQQQERKQSHQQPCEQHSQNHNSFVEFVNSNNGYEERIATGIKLVKSGKMSIRAAAKKVEVSHETLRRRYQGASSRQKFHTQLMALTPAEELTIEKMLLLFVSCSNMLTSSFLCSLVNDYRKTKAITLNKVVKDLGISWTAGFRRRHKLISDIMAKSMNKQQKESTVFKSSIDKWFEDLTEGFKKYDLELFPSNIYNFVEIGYYKHESSLRCIKRLEAKNSKILFSTMEAIRADGLILPAKFIIKSSSPTTCNLDFSASNDGWSTSEDFLIWLSTTFNKSGDNKANAATNCCRKKVIFMEPCPAIFSFKVLQFALDNQIVFFLFPNQNTYILQPFDFRLMSVYQQQIHILSINESTLSVEKFIGLLEKAKSQILTSPTIIQQSWESTGIFPLEPKKASLIKDCKKSLITGEYSALTSFPNSIFTPNRGISNSLAQGFKHFGIEKKNSDFLTNEQKKPQLKELQFQIYRNNAIHENVKGLVFHYKQCFQRYMKLKGRVDSNKNSADDFTIHKVQKSKESCLSQHKHKLYSGDGTAYSFQELEGIMNEFWNILEISLNVAIENNNTALKVFSEFENEI